MATGWVAGAFGPSGDCLPEFQYLRPRTLAEALHILHEHGASARVLAGGQSLLPTMYRGIDQPRIVVDINGITDLDRVEPDRGGYRLGALVRQQRLIDDPQLAAHQPLLAAAARLVGSPQVRHRGTLCGSLAEGNPAGELVAAACLLEARVELAAVGRRRHVTVADLYQEGSRRAADELVLSAWIPAREPGEGTAIEQVARRTNDLAMVGAAAFVRLATDGSCTAARVVVFGALPTPMLLASAARLVGQRITRDTTTAVATTACQLPFGDDIRATAHYRRTAAPVLVARALASAAQQAAADLAGRHAR